MARSARTGHPPAIADFALLQMEGYRDERGRVLVRANRKGAVRALLQVASAPGASVEQVLGYCFDVGLGVRRNSRLAMRWYLRGWRRGNPFAAANLATIYRARGQLGRAVSWWRRAIGGGVPEEAVQVGYCYQYGIGVRRDVRRAVDNYRLAIRARAILETEREAAMYHLAVLYLDSQPPKRAKAVSLLKRAARDQDYPQAMRLLRQLQEGRRLAPCRCRRDLRRTLPGGARCELHPT